MDKPKSILAVQEDDKLELTNLSRNCILHALEVLPKSAGTADVSCDLDKIKKFYQEISEIIVNNKSSVQNKKKVVQHGISDKVGATLGDSLDFDHFYKGGISSSDFLLQVEEKFNETFTEDFDHEALFRTCWQFYCAERKQQLSLSQHFSDESLYHLWLIFNAVLPPESDTMLIPVKSLHVIIKRMLDLCAHEPISFNYHGSKVELDYQDYFQAIVGCADPLKLQPSLINEVIQDMKDEIVNGILKKGYLTKKGHRRKNWRKRWFILEKTTLKYFECKEKQVLKGHMVLNVNTEVSILPDRGKRMYCFKVICGRTKVTYKIQCDDEKSRHDWMLAINKAIHLSKIFEGRATPDIGRSTQHAYLPDFHFIRFGSSQSIIPKWEGGVRIRQKPHHFSTTVLRKPKIISDLVMESDNELSSDEEENRNPARPVSITRRETESWVALNSQKYDRSRSASVQLSIPSPGAEGAFMISIAEQHGRMRSTSDTLSKHSTSTTDLPQSTPGEHTTVFEEFEKPLQEPELKLSGPNSSNSPHLDQWQGYSADSEAAGTSNSCEPKVADSHLERQNSAVERIKKKPPPAGIDDSPLLPPKVK